MEEIPNTIAILLGAGFSKPAGLPLVNEIDDYFLRDNAETLLNFSSGEWKWKDYASGPDLNNGMLGYSFCTYGFLLNEWVNAFSEEPNRFSNYEDFYQYIIDNHNADPIVRAIHLKALKAFMKYYAGIGKNSYCKYYVAAFTKPQKSEIINIMNHLIKDLLFSRLPKNDVMIEYSSFIKLFSIFESVDLITLNHDCLLEGILDEIGVDYSDGFSTERSPLRSDTGKGIKYFNNDFSKNISIIKLHGSIDVYLYNISVLEGSTLHPTGDSFYFKTHDYNEKQNPHLIHSVTGEVRQNFHSNITPQFITGTRKNEVIKGDPMYASLYSEFEKRIHANPNLLIIGYSYSDDHVNKKIVSAINSGVTSKIVNINPSMAFPFDDNRIEIVNLKNISELSSSVFYR